MKCPPFAARAATLCFRSSKEGFRSTCSRSVSQHFMQPFRTFRQVSGHAWQMQYNPAVPTHADACWGQHCCAAVAHSARVSMQLLVH